MKNRNQILILSALLALAAVPFPAMGKTITAGSYREALENPSPGPAQAPVEAEAAEEQSRQPSEQTMRFLVPDETSRHHVGKYAEPIFRVKTEKPQLALSFDAGADPGAAGTIMDILEKHQISSTFFLTGDWMDQNPETTKEIVKRGHEIGNHSVSHPSFPALTREQMDDQIQRTHQKALELTGQNMCLFRFPYGDYSREAIDAVTGNGYFPIQWSVDSIDWRNEGRQIILDRVLNHKNLGSGSIILMHLAAAYTPSALEELIVNLKDRGYEIVPVSQLIYEKNYHMDYAGNQIPEIEYKGNEDGV